MEKPDPNGLRPDLRPLWDLLEYAITRIDHNEERVDGRFTKVYFTMMGGLVFVITVLVAMGVLL